MKSEAIQNAVQHLVELNHFDNLTALVIIAIKENGEMDQIITTHLTDLIIIGALEVTKDALVKKQHSVEQPLKKPDDCGNG